VQDTGCGISAANMQNLFSPFFTTKSPDKGMGLGLSISYRIIENHHGSICFKSKENEGTSCSISFPAKKDENNIG
jgi:signal transduction histidine kinase